MRNIQLSLNLRSKVLAVLFFIAIRAFAQDQNGSEWSIVADGIDPNSYFGVTVANGMIGLVSSPYPMKINDVVLNGVYDHCQRGRVSNILKTFNHLNVELEVDGKRVGLENIAGFQQSINMKEAIFTTHFTVENKLSVKHQVMALRHLPYTAMVVIDVKALSDVEIVPINQIEAPNRLTDVHNYFSRIDRPHAFVPLLTPVADSPSGKHDVAASTSFVFEESLEEKPPGKRSKR